MKIIGANFIELESKRNPEFSGKLNIKTNIQINSLEKLEKSKDTFKVTYTFIVDYGDLGKVKLKGELYIKTDQKTLKTLMKNKEDKKHNTPEYLSITNFVVKKASIKAFELEDELGLPIHIKLPSLSIKQN